MKTFVSQTTGGVAVIASKNEKTAAKALDIPEHQFFWTETTDPTLINLAKKDEVTVVTAEADAKASKQEKKKTSAA
jgi:hypothetical protein